MTPKISWQQWTSRKQDLPSRQFVCGYCGSEVGAHSGYFNEGTPMAKLYICPNCGYPSFFLGDYQSPGPLLGREIKSLPKDIAQIYKEIRNDIQNSSFTSAVMLGRKLIMHLSVDIANAKKNLSFVQYVEHLKDSGYIPPNGDRVLSFMRKLGNEQNHEVIIGTKDQAEKVIKFVEILLIHMYELPNEFPDVDPEASSG